MNQGGDALRWGAPHRRIHATGLPRRTPPTCRRVGSLAFHGVGIASPPSFKVGTAGRLSFRRDPVPGGLCWAPPNRLASVDTRGLEPRSQSALHPRRAGQGTCSPPVGVSYRPGGPPSTLELSLAPASTSPLLVPSRVLGGALGGNPLRICTLGRSLVPSQPRRGVTCDWGTVARGTSPVRARNRLTVAPPHPTVPSRGRIGGGGRPDPGPYTSGTPVSGRWGRFGEGWAQVSRDGTAILLETLKVVVLPRRLPGGLPIYTLLSPGPGVLQRVPFFFSRCRLRSPRSP